MSKRLNINEILKIHTAVEDIVVGNTTATRESYTVNLKPKDLVNESQWIRMTGLLEAEVKLKLSKASRLVLSVTFAEETFEKSFSDIGSEIVLLVEKSINEV